MIPVHLRPHTRKAKTAPPRPTKQHTSHVPRTRDSIIDDVKRPPPPMDLQTELDVPKTGAASTPPATEQVNHWSMGLGAWLVFGGLVQLSVDPRLFCATSDHGFSWFGSTFRAVPYTGCAVCSGPS